MMAINDVVRSIYEGNTLLALILLNGIGFFALDKKEHPHTRTIDDDVAVATEVASLPPDASLGNYNRLLCLPDALKVTGYTTEHVHIALDRIPVYEFSRPSLYGLLAAVK